MSGKPLYPLLMAGMLALTGMAACQSAQPPLAAQPPAVSVPGSSRQLMIRFEPGTVACDAAAIARFAAAVRVSLEFLRPMSGNACVVRQTAPDVQRLQDDLETLKRHPAVQWAEPDTVMKAL